jgi:hypothetical protein
MTIKHDIDTGDPRIKLSIVIMLLLALLTIGSTLQLWWVSTISSSSINHESRLSIVETNQKIVLQSIPKLDTTIEQLQKTVQELSTQLAVHEVTTKQLLNKR